jgi:hypothetical protein
MAADLSLNNRSVARCLQEMEADCILVRTYRRPLAGTWGPENGGYNALLSIELVDPDMWLPEPPPPPHPQVIEARENRELDELTAREPTADRIIEALLARNDELVEQLAKLQDIIEAQEAEKQKAARQENHRPPEHLTQRVRAALRPEQWEDLRH